MTIVYCFLAILYVTLRAHFGAQLRAFPVLYAIGASLSIFAIVIILLLMMLKKRFVSGSKTTTILLLVGFLSLLLAELTWSITIQDHPLIFTFLGKISNYFYILFALVISAVLFKENREILKNSYTRYIVISVFVTFSVFVIFSLGLLDNFESKKYGYKFYQTIFYNICLAFIFSLSIVNTVKTNNLINFIFYQSLMMYCIADLSYQYQDAFSPGVYEFNTELLWQLSFDIQLFTLISEWHKPRLLKKMKYVPLRSLRVSIAVIFLFILILFTVLLDRLNLFKIIGFHEFTIIIALLSIFWFAANFLSLLISLQLKKLSIIINGLSNIFSGFIHKLKSGYEINIGEGGKIFPKFNNKFPSDETIKLLQEYDYLADNITKTIKLFANQKEQLAVNKTMSMISHDIKKPFFLIKNRLKELQEKGNDKQLVCDIENSIDFVLQKVERLTEDLVTFYHKKLVKEVIQLEDIINESVLESKLAGKNLEFKVDYDFTGKRQLYGDKIKLRRVIDNIFLNAIESSNGNCKIFVKVSRTAIKNCDNFIISIVNTNSVIDSKLESKIFDTFFTFGKKNGTGLGLAICKEILEAHNGKIILNNNNHVGPEFIITIPVGEDEHCRLKSESKINKKNSHIKILFIDDEPLFLEANKMSIDKVFKKYDVRHEILTISDPEKALAILKDREINYVFCDINFNNSLLSGYDVFKQAMLVNKNIEFYFISSVLLVEVKTNLPHFPTNKVYSPPLSIEAVEKIFSDII